MENDGENDKNDENDDSILFRRQEDKDEVDVYKTNLETDQQNQLYVHITLRSFCFSCKQTNIHSLSYFDDCSILQDKKDAIDYFSPSV